MMLQITLLFLFKIYQKKKISKIKKYVEDLELDKNNLKVINEIKFFRKIIKKII